MSFPRYPKYRNSGVEWLGDVPAHWEVKPIRKSAKLESGHTPSRSHPEYWVNCTVPWFTLADVWQIREGGADYIHETKEKVSETGLANSSARLLPRGTVMLSRTASVGFSAIMGVGMATSQDFANWVCGPSLKPEFLLQVLRSMRAEFDRMMMGSTHNTIYMPDIQALRFALPSVAEQVAIVGFVGRETAKIDALVAEQKRLIDLLKEKRQSVISHAVTKGLNPDAPMKPSGVEWLGDVPAHWGVKVLKRLIRDNTTISYGIVQPGDPLDEGVPFVQTTNMTTGAFGLADLQRTSVEIAGQYPRSRLCGGEVILGIRASIGAAHVVPGHLNGANLSRGVARIVPSAEVMSDYLVAFLGTGAAAHYWQLCRQGSTFNEVSIETVRELAMCLPPPREQVAIVEVVAVEAERLDTLTAEAERAIDLLQERRTALISAAVTGQIDVRGLVASEVA